MGIRNVENDERCILEPVTGVLLGVLFFCVVSLYADVAHAQQGAGIFKNAACNLLDEVLTKDFGAMLTALAGLFALIAAVAGSFRMAWVLLFVSVGIFIFPKFVEMLFPLGC